MKSEIVEVAGNPILCIKEGEKVWVFVKSVCEAIGIDFSHQSVKIKAHEILGEQVDVKNMMDKTNRPQSSIVLPIQFVAGWLFSIEADRVNEKAKPILLSFQRECFQVLFNHFFGSYRNVRNNQSAIVELRKQLRDCTDIIKHNKAKSKVLNKQIEQLMQDNCVQLGIDWNEVKEVPELEAD